MYSNPAFKNYAYLEIISYSFSYVSYRRVTVVFPQRRWQTGERDFIDKPNLSSRLRARSRNGRVSSVGSNRVGIICSARFIAARKAQMVDAEMSAQMAKCFVSYLRNIQPTIILQKTTNPLMTDRYVDDLPVAGNDDKFQTTTADCI